MGSEKELNPATHAVSTAAVDHARYSAFAEQRVSKTISNCYYTAPQPGGPGSEYPLLKF
jgi:hypothetical protein